MSHTDAVKEAERVRACVKAMAGISDPAALVASHAEMLDLLTRQGDGETLMDDEVEPLLARARACREGKP